MWLNMFQNAIAISHKIHLTQELRIYKTMQGLKRAVFINLHLNLSYMNYYIWGFIQRVGCKHWFQEITECYMRFFGNVWTSFSKIKRFLLNEFCIFCSNIYRIFFYRKHFFFLVLYFSWVSSQRLCI